MKETLAGLGVAGLLCLPCLILGGVVGLAMVGGALAALATSPLTQVAGLALVAAGVALYWRARRRAACAVDCAPEAGPEHADAGSIAAGHPAGRKQVEAVDSVAHRPPGRPR